MIVSGIMQKRCDAVLFLDDWLDSEGAKRECRRSARLGQQPYFSIRDVPRACGTGAEKAGGSK